MLTNCLAKCAHLTITVSETERDIGRKSSFFIPLAFDAPVRGRVPSEQRHPVWCRKTRMARLPDGEKISKIFLFVLEQLTNVTHTHIHRPRLCIASRGKKRPTFLNVMNKYRVALFHGVCPFHGVCNVQWRSSTKIYRGFVVVRNFQYVNAACTSLFLHLQIKVSAPLLLT